VQGEGGAGQSAKGDESMWSHFRLAQADQTVSADAVNVGGSERQEPVRLEEVVVTAQKKEERLQDVPEAITVLNPDTLALNGHNSLVDYFASVPGLSLVNTAYTGGTHYLTIRGLSAGQGQNATVATVIDDVPVVSSLASEAGQYTSPDLDPSDLARIEVLKGPQGTLYGASSLSGLIKYVTVDPSTAEFNGRVEVTGSDIPKGGTGYSVRAAVNIPVSDTFAFRLSGFDRHDPGYINDVSTGEDNFNWTNTFGGHAAALWRPSDDFSVKLSALVQKAFGYNGLVDSNSLGQPSLGGLDFTSLPGTAWWNTQAQLYSATVNWKVDGLDFTSLTGYVVNGIKNDDDQTFYLGYYGYLCSLAPEQTSKNCSPPGNPSGTLGTPYLWNTTLHKVSEELRVASSVGKWLDWRIGGFYTHEFCASTDYFEAANLLTGALLDYPGGLYSEKSSQSFHEYAVFGDVTAHITDRFDVQIGGREEWNEQAFQEVDNGIGTYFFDGGPAPHHLPPDSAPGNAFTYEVTPRYKITPDLMTYLRVATGYRIGGYNGAAEAALLAGYNVPATCAPDRTTNYEVGVKYDGLEHLVSFDVAAYHIAWKDFQLPVQTPNQFYGYTTNAGNAKSDGVEFSIETHPMQGLKIVVEGSFTNAVLTQGLPSISAVYGPEGTPLPYSMKYSGGLFVDQDVHLTSQWTAFFGGSVNYVGSRFAELIYGTPSPANPRLEYPAYTQVNLHSGVHHDSLLMNLYVNNVTDKRGIVGMNNNNSYNTPGGFYTTFIQPRTVGVNISKTF
jgi:iron complex outermembrane receptor protein